MATVQSKSGAAPDNATPSPEWIRAKPLRHPGRTIWAVVIVVGLFLFLYGAATNPAYDWDTYLKYLFDQRFWQAAGITLLLTVLAMALGVALGVALAVMRLTPNRIMQSVSWVYVWIFRGTPVYVQLVFWGLFSTIYPHLSFGIPFFHSFFSVETASFAENVFWLAVIGLALNEAAYMAEIVRGGIQSVDEGQSEAATALGMSRAMALRLVILPQAMRSIIPPTGNEVISMLKTTSLVTAVPYTYDLYARARDLSVETFNPVPMLLIASTWYLAFTSVLMIGQHYLERHFAKGASKVMSDRQLQALADAEQIHASQDNR
ncbi:MAG: amino acid ABC transporter permease [Candidatus Nanopelagicales bacterium]